MPLTDALVIIPSHTSLNFITIIPSQHCLPFRPVSHGLFIFIPLVYGHIRIYRTFPQSITQNTRARPGDLRGGARDRQGFFEACACRETRRITFHCLFDAAIIPYHTFTFSFIIFFFDWPTVSLLVYIYLVLFLLFSLAHGYVSRCPDISLMRFGFLLWYEYCTICTLQILLPLPYWPDPLAPLPSLSPH